MLEAGYPITRTQVLQVLREALEPLPYTHALWEGGAAAFGRVDDWSDIDLQLDVDDEYAAEAAAQAERALARLAPIDLKYDWPQPAWHGHLQTFYRLQGASPYLLVDFVVIKHSNPNKFLQPEIHGQALVHFDKTGTVRADPLDIAGFVSQLRSRLETLRVTFDLFECMTLKELNRANWMEAVAFYHGMTLRPLVEVLRMRYCPARYNFHTRYVHIDLPREAGQRLEPLFFPVDGDDLRRKHHLAGEWFRAALAEVDLEQVARGLAGS